MQKFIIGKLYGHRNGVCEYKGVATNPVTYEDNHLLAFKDGVIYSPDEVTKLIEVKYHYKTSMSADPWVTLKEKAKKIAREEKWTGDSYVGIFSKN